MSETKEEIKIPEGFTKIATDFINDILITFPEYTNIIKRWWNLPNCEKLMDDSVAELNLFKHCLKIFPERFFDILNKNVDIFTDDASTVNTEFLPGIVFKYLWKCEISDNTRETIWKYLQLMLFSVISSVNNPTDLGDAAKIFENMDEDLIKSKLAETLEGMQNMFGNSEDSSSSTFANMPAPSAEDIHTHLNDMMKGKLGKFAMEFAEETAKDLNLDMGNDTNAKDAFQKLFKNPGNLMNVVKNVGTKIDEKIKSGELTQSEIISEGMDILNKMKSVPGMENIQNMFSQMGLGKNAKVNMSAMEAQMQQSLKMAQMKERMRKKAETKMPTTTSTSTQQSTTTSLSDAQLESLFNNNNTSEPEKSKKKKKSKK
jgi:hypothetical protein